jgi:hypothetical protein
MNDNDSDKELMKKYIHVIRNSNTFNIETLNSINNLSKDNRLELLIIYNEMIGYYRSFFETYYKNYKL